MISNADIEAIRNRRRDEGKPLKSNTVIKDGKHYHYKTDKRGRVEIVNRD